MHKAALEKRREKLLAKAAERGPTFVPKVGKDDSSSSSSSSSSSDSDSSSSSSDVSTVFVSIFQPRVAIVVL